MSLQNPDLVMIALGSDGQPACWFGPPLEKGVHLRWAFQPQLGFPAQGFALYRRAHVAGNLIDLPGQVLALPSIPFPEPVRRVVAEFTNPSWVPSFPPPRPLPGLVGLFENVPVSESSQPALARPRAIFSLENDALDAVRVEAPGRWRLDRVRYVPVSQDVGDPSWNRLATLCLPLTDVNYPCHRGNPNDAADREEAASRIPGGAVRNLYLGSPETVGDDWEHLHKSLTYLHNPPIPTSFVIEPAAERNLPGSVTTPLDLLLLASIDPYIARILGLYWLDQSAQPGQVYDYKIEGQWQKDQFTWPEVTVDFEADAVGRPLRQIVPRDDLILWTPGRGTVIEIAGAPWNDTRHALDLIQPTTGPHLRIHLQQPVVEVQLYLRVFSGQPELQPFLVGRIDSTLDDVFGQRWQSRDGQFVILTVRVKSPSDRIEFVSLQPARLLPKVETLRVALCKVGLVSTWSPPIYEKRAWIVYKLTSGASTPLPAPTSLVVQPVPTPTRELENGVVASGPRAGLCWNVSLSDEVLLPGQPVRYVVQRQALGSGAAPKAITESAWQMIRQADRPDVPATVSVADGTAPCFFIDDPAVALAQSQADRFYAYRVAGVDLFGRQSLYSASAVGDLTDKEAPPPPLNVEAKYLDRTDPDLSEDEVKWLEANATAQSGLNVRWEWPPSLRRQAPDAREFRVYAQRGRLNVIVGQVAQVLANEDGTFTAITNQTFPSDKIDAFVGEWFSSGGVYFNVIHNTVGLNFALTIRSPDAPPPARPILGPFTLSIHPPRLLEGTITKVRRYFSGRGWKFTFTTDQNTNVAANGLAGKWLRQGGQDFVIESNTTGVNFRITAVGRAHSLAAPSKVGFVVMEERVIDGRPTRVPVVADPGNPLYADYRRPENWAERLHVEPLAEPIAGFVGAVDVNDETGTSLVSTDQTLDDPEHRFDRGTLINNGREFRVVAHTEGPKFELTVTNLQDSDGTIVVPSTGPFEYHMGYKTIIPFSIGDATGEPVGYAQVAVSTADDKDYVSDDPKWNGTALGGRSGNEGMVSAPVVLQKALRQEPARPDAPDVGDGIATPADYYGHSFIAVRWQKQNGMRFEVYRALDETIFAADRSAHLTRSTNRSDYPWLSDAAFEALVAQQPNYAALSDELLQALASLPSNETAFGLITTELLDTDSYKATLDGRATNRHCFALKVVDVAGNRSRLGWPSNPVRAPKVMPPHAPVITKVLGGDRQITIRWASNREPDLREYQVYRSESEQAARDPRLMTLVHTEPVPPGDPAARPADMAWTDNSVRGLMTYFYCIVAVDDAGNVSTRSSPVAAQACDQVPPEPSSWVSAAWNANGSGIELSWTSSDPNVQTVVLRRNSGAWRPVSSWLPAGVTSLTDSTADSAVENRYRLRVRNGAGNVNITYIEIAIAPL